MRVIITGGGTGGHVYPGIAIADELKKENASHEILFIGAQGRMEMQHVPAAGYRIMGLPIKGISRKMHQWFKNFTLPFWVLVSLYNARRIIKQFKPDIVVGTGGYASFPTVYMAAKLRIPVVLQEQNAYPGMVNRILARYAQKVAVAYEHMDVYFPKHKLVVTGNPIRLAITNVPTNYQAGLAYFGLSPHRFTLLILGGSLGARVISQAIMQAHDVWSEQGLQVILSTGKAHFSALEKEIASLDPSVIKVLPYIDRMDLALSAADLVVSRAGAIAIAEIAAAHKPAIFIPSPHVVANHQMKNTLPLLAKDAALVVKEEKVADQLMTTIIQLVQDKLWRARLSENLGNFFPKNAANNIVSIMENLSQRREIGSI